MSLYNLGYLGFRVYGVGFKLSGCGVLGNFRAVGEAHGGMSG